MARRGIYLIPGFMCSDLGRVATGEVLWWDKNAAVFVQLGALRLAANGIDPGPPDGEPCGFDPDPQWPWLQIGKQLTRQFNQDDWFIAQVNWDWRKDIARTGEKVGKLIEEQATPQEPATLVGHSAGGLVAVLAWSYLVSVGKQNLIRRLITIVTPFQGSYLPLEFMAGYDPSIRDIVNAINLWGTSFSVPIGQSTLLWANGLFCTFPAFYELFPQLGGLESGRDPHRAILFDAANYPALMPVSQPWLTYSAQQWNATINDPSTFPPDWVATYVVGMGLRTPYALVGPNIPTYPGRLLYDNLGDGVVESGSAWRSPGAIEVVSGEHSSIPLAMAQSGLLMALINDPRHPPDPPPPPNSVPVVLPTKVGPPPNSDPEPGIVCIGGG